MLLDGKRWLSGRAEMFFRLLFWERMDGKKQPEKTEAV